MNAWARRGSRALAVAAAVSLVAVGGVASGAQPSGAQPSVEGPERRAGREATARNTTMAGDCRADGVVTTGAIFNNPHDDNAGDRRILEHIECLIEGTPKGERIQVATYHFADNGQTGTGQDGVVDKLIDAVERGVTVEIIVDRGVQHGGEDGRFFEEFERAAAEHGETDSYIRPCPGYNNGDGDYDRACIADRKMHNKLFTFSETHGVPNVTFLTTSNVEDDDVDHGGNGNSGTDMWNSGYTAANDEPLYDWFADRYFVDLANGEYIEDYYEANDLPAEKGNYRVFHSPRKSGRTVMQILNDIACTGNTSGGTDPGHRTIVRVSMSEFSHTGGFGPQVAGKLRELDDDGCYVDIVANKIDYDSDDPANDGSLRTLLRKPERESDGGWRYHGPEVREFNNGLPQNRHGVHDKNLMIDGNFGDQINRKVVFTGTVNFTRPSAGEAGDSYQVNDETWLQINDAGVHDRFVENFEVIRDSAHTCWQTSKPVGCDGGRTYPGTSGELNCHETADEYQGAGNLYLYGPIKCDGAHGAKDDSTEDRDYGDGKGQIEDFDNEVDSIVNTTDKHIKFYNYPNYNAGHPEGDSFCLRPDQWINRISKYSDGHRSWSNSISSHRMVDDPEAECDRWFGGYHEPNR